MLERFCIGVVFLLFVSVFSACSTEYRDHWDRYHEKISVLVQTGSSEGELSIFPSDFGYSSLLDRIHATEKTLWVNTYIWTDLGLLDAVVDAKKRGVDVRVILENLPYNSPYLSQVVPKQLVENGIERKTPNHQRITFDHAKYWILDDTWCVSTGNWTKSAFSANRELIWCSEDIAVHKNLTELFLDDFSGKKPFFSDGLSDRLGISGVNMRSWLRKRLINAENRIWIYNQTVSDPEFIDLLTELQKDGKDVRICTAESEDALKDHNWIQVPGTVFVKSPYPHLKLFILDDTFLVGSLNLSTNAIDNNREILYHVLGNKKSIQQAENLFLKDCSG